MTWSEVPQSKDEMLSRAVRAAFLNRDEIMDLCDEGMNPNQEHNIQECLKVLDDANKFIKRHTLEEIHLF